MLSGQSADIVSFKDRIRTLEGELSRQNAVVQQMEASAAESQETIVRLEGEKNQLNVAMKGMEISAGEGARELQRVQAENQLLQAQLMEMRGLTKQIEAKGGDAMRAADALKDRERALTDQVCVRASGLLQFLYSKNNPALLFY